MSGESEFERGKIRDSQLSAFAERETTGTASVIIELAGGSSPVTLTGRGGAPRAIAMRPGNEESERRQMDRLETELKRLGLGPLVRLDAAQAFVADVDPGRLRAVTRLSLTGAVRPNRTHSVGDSSPRDPNAE